MDTHVTVQIVNQHIASFYTLKTKQLTTLSALLVVASWDTAL